MQKSHPTYWSTNPDFFVDDHDNPYTTPDGKPFRWIRSRRVGGRTLVWDAVTPRFSDFEFKAASRDGYRARLADHATPTSRRTTPDLERFLGVHGSREGLAAAARRRVPRAAADDARRGASFKERVESAVRAIAR